MYRCVTTLVHRWVGSGWVMAVRMSLDWVDRMTGWVVQNGPTTMSDMWLLMPPEPMTIPEIPNLLDICGGRTVAYIRKCWITQHLDYVYSITKFRRDSLAVSGRLVCLKSLFCPLWGSFWGFCSINREQYQQDHECISYRENVSYNVLVDFII